MTKQDRQGRVIASAVFVSLFFIWGSGYETFPIFFPALLKNFGWSKARLGLMSMGFSVGFIPSVLVAGWLLLGVIGHVLSFLFSTVILIAAVVAVVWALRILL